MTPKYFNSAEDRVNYKLMLIKQNGWSKATLALISMFKILYLENDRVIFTFVSSMIYETFGRANHFSQLKSTIEYGIRITEWMYLSLN